MQEFRKRIAVPGDPLPGLPLWESELLRARGADTPEKAERFLRPGLDGLYPPEKMQDLEKAVELIRAAVREGKRILVYGDYDADGISAVTVLLETLLEEGADAEFRIPGRHTEGYGLNEQAVRDAAESFQLLITVDCGIANVKEVRLAKELGMQVIVTDHHQLPEELPEADAVLNPLLGDYPFRYLCGAGVALKLSLALGGPETLEKRLEIAALATVADIVPLTDENRIIVREGMRRMERTERPGLRTLMENAGVSFPLRAEDIAFRLAPRLNAAGRLEDADQGVRLLMTRDPAEAERLAKHLDENNRIRQDMERKILKEAENERKKQTNLQRDRILIIEGENWNTGLIGLAAGKLCERFHHPVIVLNRQEDKAVGSCRSIPGVNIFEMLNRCGVEFLRFGGHAQAAGLTVAADKIRELRERLNETIREHCSDRLFLPAEEYDSELAPEQVTPEMIAELDKLEPTGCGNPPPMFLCRGAEVQEIRRVGRDQSHLKLTLLAGETVLDGIGFGLGNLADLAPDRVDVLFRPEMNEFRGRSVPQLRIRAIRPADANGTEVREDPEGFFLDCLQEMARLSANEKEHPAEGPGLRPEYLLKDRMDRLDPSREALGAVYLALKAGNRESLAELAGAAEAPEEQVLFALTAFEELGLVRWEREPFRAELIPAARRTDLTRSPLVRYVLECGRKGP